MSGTIRPLRSVLYMPGSNARALDKAKSIPADALILDLEDAVAPDAKDLARTQVCAAARSGEYGHRQIAIRVNGLDTPWGEADLVAAAAAGPDAILVPKISSGDMIRDLAERMARAGAPERTALWAMMETPSGMLRAAEIASAHPRLRVLVMGTNDLAKELHAAHVPGREPLLTGLGLCLLAARASGLVAIDGVYNDIKDEEGFAAECAQGVRLGFDGKTLIHPSQVAPCNAAWAPDASEIEHARRVIAAFEEAAAQGKGVATVDGRMIENLHVENARRALALAEALAARGGSV